MAAVTTSHFISTTPDIKATLTPNGGPIIKPQYSSLNNAHHSGLRTLNSIDRLLHYSRVFSSLTKEGNVAKIGSSSRGLLSVIKSGTGMNLVFVGAEMAPWSKTGGLGDVLGGLPAAMAALGHRVMTISPRYDQYRDGWDTSVTADVRVGDRTETVRFFHCYKRGVDRVFVDHPLFLARVWGKTESKIYGPKAGEDYPDNQLRFSMLCQAALKAPRLLNLNNNPFYSGPYGDDVVFIANDWHTALVPCYLKTMYKPRGIYRNAKVAFCMHNITYQGRFAPSDFSLLNLPDQFKSSFDFMDGYDKPVRGRKMNWMKAGILEADKVVTVSPHYAEELVSGIERGVELDSIVRMTGVTGIVNGMDVQEWNPATDKYLDIKYDPQTVMDAKPIIKEALQAEVGLPVDRNIPLIGFIGRLEEQKGSDILAEAIPQFIEQQNVQLIVLGTGKMRMERQMEQLEMLYPEKARGVTNFNVPLAHMIIAGSDFMLIPSRFEPCGLNQLYAMRYGTVPIVASTGGLVDTVKEGFTGIQMGCFSADCDAVDPADVSAVAMTVKRILPIFGTPTMAQMIQNCMAQDLSWKEPARKWERMLLDLKVGVGGPGLGGGEEIAPLAMENIPAP